MESNDATNNHLSNVTFNDIEKVVVRNRLEKMFTLVLSNENDPKQK